MTWTGPAFKKLFKVQLVADSAFAALTPEVSVFTYWPGKDERTTDAVLLYAIRPGRLESAAVGDDNRSKDDIYTVLGQVEVIRPGAGEVEANAAADAAAAIFDRVIAVANTRPQVGNQTLNVTIGDEELSEFPGTVGDNTPVRVCVLAFGIEVVARVSVTV